MNNIKYRILFLLLLSCNLALNAQVVDPNSTDEMFTINTPITIDMDEEDEEAEEDFVEAKKKKRKKKVFYGIKTKKRYVQTGYGDGVVYEQFYVLKEPEALDPYVRDIYWLDTRRKAIRKGGKFDPKYGSILHGTYRKVKGDQVLEEGIFYKGMKHGRWMKYDKDNLLVDKEKYYKGWPKESMVSYYGTDREKMKEIVPIEYGEKEGNYFYFHKSGRVAVKGEFKWDHKVGDWIEYYASGRRKKVIRYSKDPFDDEYRPFIWKEWTAKGQLVYEKR